MPDLKVGDILLFDSNKLGPRIVKFFMTAPTVWHHIYRAITNTQEKVAYYHAAMVYVGDFMIEQQWKVRITSIPKNTPFLVVRKKTLTQAQAITLETIAVRDIDKNWDILNVLGKTLTWLTGIKWFARYIQWPEQEICINRVASWYYRATGELFGAKEFEELTTHNLYKWVITHTQTWEVFNV